MHCYKSKAVWISIILLLTWIMIAVGGLTRLTGSGLSMVSWDLIQGIFPPLNLLEWERTFSAYKDFPEFQKINYQMNLEEFKNIFYFEYFHRLLGRLIGLMTIIPLIYFWFRKKLSLSEIFHFFSLFVLVTVQGLVGWYMVQSGLVDIPSVSHYRLVGHFFLALLFLGYCSFLLNKYLNLKPQKILITNSLLIKILQPKVINFVLILFLIQLLYGSLTAGLDAGLVSSTYPKMYGSWIPIKLFNLKNSEYTIFSLFFENPFFINFFHRHLGILTALVLLVFSYAVMISYKNSYLKWVGMSVFFLSLVQPILGIISLIFNIPVSLASLHQMVAIFIFEGIIFVKWQLKRL